MTLNCNEDIQAAVDQATGFLELNGLDSNSILRFRLILEELLFVYGEALGDGTFEIRCIRSRRRIRVVLRVPGKEFNPFEEEKSPILAKTMSGLLHAPVWSYARGKNQIIYAPYLYLPGYQELRYIWKYMKQEKCFFIMAVTAKIMESVLSVVLPILSARMIVAYTDYEFHRILLTALAIAITRLISNAMLAFSEYFHNKSYYGMLNAMELDLQECVLSLENSCMEKFGSGMFIQRLTNDVDRVALGFGQITDKISTILQYTGVLVAIALVSPVMFLYQLSTLVVLTAIEMRRVRILNQDDRRYRKVNERYTGFVTEIIRGSREIKGLNNRETFLNELKTRIENRNELQAQMKNRTNRYKILRWDLREILDFGYMLLLTLLLIRGKITAPRALVLFNYNLGMYAATVIFGQVMEMIKDFSLSAERVYQLMHSPDFPKEHFGTMHCDRLKGNICFRDVSFTYNYKSLEGRGKPVLKHLDFEVKAGESVAIVGKSGCGKTTIFNLLTRLYDVNSGEITIDGINVQSMDEATLRGNIAIVNQNPYIFHMSFRENLALVKPDMTEEEMIHVCRQACIHEEIMSQPDGYDTVLGEGGLNLSGGQRQRLAIARSLLCRREIIMLDEATSALDNKTQNLIQQTISNISDQCTILMIAHRLSTVIHCKKIIFISDGKVLAEGSHETLLETCEEYRELYSQSSTEIMK